MLDTAVADRPGSLPPITAAGFGASAREAALLNLVLMAVGEALAGTRGQATDEEIALVRGMGHRGGNGGAGIDAVYRRYADRIYRFIYWRVGERREDAEELTLDTFMTALDLCQGFDGRSSVFAWLCGIAKLQMIHHHRRQTRQKRSNGQSTVSLTELDEAVSAAGASGRTPMEELLERISASQVLDLALRRISADEKEALMLQQIDGLSVREIAIHLKRSEDAVDSLIRRAKAKLRDVIQGLVGQEDAR